LVFVYVSDRSNPKAPLGLSLKIFQKLLYPRAKGIFAQTSLSKELLYKHTGNKNILLVPNPIKVIPNLNIDRKNIILNVGRLVEEKDQLTLIRMFANISIKGWELHIVGEGPLRGLLEKEINELGLEDSVKLLGRQKDLSKYFSRSKIFAFTSISEGYPNALCEAMAFPLACISFDCDAGPRDIIKNQENGFLVNMGDTEAYEKKLIELISSDELQQKLCTESIKIAHKQTVDVIGDYILKEFKNESFN
jgi:glycosyltransferase involved in cell wall biosynthesis